MQNSMKVILFYAYDLIIFMIIFSKSQKRYREREMEEN